MPYFPGGRPIGAAPLPDTDKIHRTKDGQYAVNGTLVPDNDWVPPKGAKVIQLRSNAIPDDPPAKVRSTTKNGKY